MPICNNYCIMKDYVTRQEEIKQHCRNNNHYENKNGFTKHMVQIVSKKQDERNLSSRSVPAKSSSFGTGHDKNLSERPSYL